MEIDNLTPKSMMSILRNVESGICRPYNDHPRPTVSSQVSDKKYRPTLPTFG